ncbi:hypothetical protein M9458_034941, partial [Cirrhinus mrigala]
EPRRLHRGGAGVLQVISHCGHHRRRHQPSPVFHASAPPPVSHGSPSVHPQRNNLSASWPEEPSSLLSGSESWTPPWPSDPAAAPRLLAPFVPLAPPWSVVNQPSPQDSTPPAAPHRPFHQLHWAPPSIQLCLSPL